jgi:hypothetical protein
MWKDVYTVMLIYISNTIYARNQVHTMGNYLTVTEYINEHEEQAYTMTLIN